MGTIETHSSLGHLTAALHNNEPIALYDDGSWQKKERMPALIHSHLIESDTSSTIQLAKALKRLLKHDEVQKRTTKRRLQSNSYSQEEAASAVEAILEKLNQLRTSKAQKQKINKTTSALQRAYTAYTYRHLPEAQIAVSTTHVAHETAQSKIWLHKAVQKWKSERFPPQDEHLTDDELQKINAIIQYKDIFPLLQQDKKYRDFLFRFVFLNNSKSCNDLVSIAVQFPQIAKKLEKAFLDKRISTLSKTLGLQLQEMHGKKEVLLRIQDELVPICDFTRSITINDPRHPEKMRTLTIQELFQEFINKHEVRMGDFEYTEKGVTLCYPAKPLLNYQKATWWEDLPVLERLTKEEVEEKCQIKLHHDGSVLSIAASRSNEPENIENNHAWFLLYIPHAEGGYTAHAIGKYARDYPPGGCGALRYIFMTLPAIFSVVDENQFYRHRLHCQVSVELTKTQFIKLTEKLKTDLQSAEAGNVVFQPQGDNCSVWVQEVVDDVFGKDALPRIFETPLVKTTARFPVNIAIKSLNFIDARISRQASLTMQKTIGFLLGGRQETVVYEGDTQISKQLLNYTPWTNGYLSIPAQLFLRKEQLQAGFDALRAHTTTNQE